MVRHVPTAQSAQFILSANKNKRTGFISCTLRDVLCEPDLWHGEMKADVRQGKWTCSAPLNNCLNLYGDYAENQKTCSFLLFGYLHRTDRSWRLHKRIFLKILASNLFAFQLSHFFITVGYHTHNSGGYVKISHHSKILTPYTELYPSGYLCGA